MAPHKIVFLGLVFLSCAMLSVLAQEDDHFLTLAPVNPVIDPYVFDEFNTTNSIGARSEVVSGTDSGYNNVFILGGSNYTTISNTGYKFNLATRTWSDLPIQFSRVGACSSQDNNRAVIWIYGGTPSGTVNTALFMTFNLATNAFTDLPNPPNDLLTVEVACAANGAGTNFYVLFGDESGTEENCTTPVTSVAVYTASPANWSRVTTTGTAPTPRRGANAMLLANQLIVFGGMCGSEYYNDVYRLDLGNYNWTKDSFVGPNEAPIGREFASAYVQGQSPNANLFVYGGETAMGVVDTAYVYNLNTHVWTTINTTSMPPEARQNAATVPLFNRAFIYGGETQGGVYYADSYQLLSEVNCLNQPCETCLATASNGCGWCNDNNGGYQCVVGDENGPFGSASCNASSTSFITDIDRCPQTFPSYVIALLVIGGVVVVGIVIFAIMKVRSGDEKQGYERIA